MGLPPVDKAWCLLSMEHGDLEGGVIDLWSASSESSLLECGLRGPKTCLCGSRRDIRKEFQMQNTGHRADLLALSL